jgi:hypothetical protein
MSLQGQDNYFIGFEVLTAVTVKSLPFWNVVPCTLVRRRRNVSPPASGLKSELRSACSLLYAGFFLGLPFDPRGEGDMFLCIVG